MHFSWPGHMPQILNLCQWALCAQVIQLLHLPKPFCFARVAPSARREEGYIGKNIIHKVYIREI